MTAPTTPAEGTKKRRNRRRIAIIAIPLAGAAIAGTAYAAWLVNSGDPAESQDVVAGSVPAGALTVNKVTPPVNGLTPTNEATSTFTVTNNLDYAVTLTQGVLDATILVSGGIGPGCTDAAAADVTGVLADVSGVTIDAGETLSDPAFAITVAMGADSHNDCQSATFTPQVQVAGQSS